MFDSVNSVQYMRNTILWIWVFSNKRITFITKVTSSAAAIDDIFYNFFLISRPALWNLINATLDNAWMDYSIFLWIYNSA